MANNDYTRRRHWTSLHQFTAIPWPPRTKLNMTFDLNDNELLLLMKQLDTLEILELHATIDITYASLQHFPTYWPHLESITLSLTKIPRAFITLLGQHYQHSLRRLHLSQRSREFWPGMFLALAACPLETLGVSSLYPLFTDYDTAMLEQAVVDLTRFSLSIFGAPASFTLRF
ncbi:unnamed protein product [Absidia cylindrospora]